MSTPLQCPYCGQPAVLTNSSVIYGKSYVGNNLSKQSKIWLCKPCNAYVGCHKGTTTPLGTMANAALRDWRQKAHAAFDPHWKSGRLSRNAAYQLLSEVMQMPLEKSHIGMFEIPQCQKTVAFFSSLQSQSDSKQTGSPKEKRL